MALYALPILMAFLVTHISTTREEAAPGRDGLPLVFAIFCLVCVALSLLEALWPPFAAGIAAMDPLMPRL